MTLEFGDIAFWGNGPNDEPWWIGIEYKKIDDMIASIHSGRFTGTQLPGMLRDYNVCFVFVEGITFMDRQTGGLIKKMGKYRTGMRIQYSGYHNALTSIETHAALAGKPCNVRHTVSLEETTALIKATYAWFQKPWDKHTMISRPDGTKIQRVSYDMEVVKFQPGEPEYPKYWLRKAIFQIDRMGWDVAGKIADRFQTMENLLKAGQDDIEGVERVGKGLAERLYVTLHGYPDPEVQKRKRKPKTVDTGDNL